MEFIREYQVIIVGIVILYMVILGGFCAFLAQEKLYSAHSWFWLGFFFGVFALIAAAGLPDKEMKNNLVKMKVMLEREQFYSSIEREEKKKEGM